MCADALWCCGESQHLGNGPPSLGAGWSTLSCPLIIIQGRHEKEPFWFETSHASQFFCKDIFQIPRIQLLCYPPGPPAGKFGFQMQLVKWLLCVVQPSWQSLTSLPAPPSESLSLKRGWGALLESSGPQERTAKGVRNGTLDPPPFKRWKFWEGTKCYKSRRGGVRCCGWRGGKRRGSTHRDR